MIRSIRFFFAALALGVQAMAPHASAQTNQPPALVCPNYVTTTITVINMLPVVEAQELVLSLQDDTTPLEELKVGVRFEGVGAGFPFAEDGVNGRQYLQFGTSIGVYPVEVWAMDAEGLTAMCATMVIVYEPTGSICDMGPKREINVKTENGVCVALQQMDMHISGGLYTGNYRLDWSAYGACSYFEGLSVHALNHTLGYSPVTTYRPFNYEGYRNGVDAADLALLRKHLDSGSPFKSPLKTPYQRIAADVDGSGAIDEHDADLLRDLILGNIDALPGMPSWRFVPANHDFDDAGNLSANALPDFPEIMVFEYNLWDMPPMPAEFIGVKLGDLDRSARTDIYVEGAFAPAPGGNEALRLWVADRQLEIGEIFEATLVPESPTEALDMRLRWEGLELLDVSGECGMGSGNGARGARLVCDRSGTAPVLRFKALKAGRLSDMLMPDTRAPLALRAFAGEALTVREAELHFAGVAESDAAFEMLLAPNPLALGEQAAIWLRAENASSARIQVFDAAGRPIHAFKTVLSAGMNRVELAAFAVPGVYVVVAQLDNGLTARCRVVAGSRE